MIVNDTASSGATGRRVTFRSSDCTVNKTVPRSSLSGFGRSCYSWNTTTHANSGCEHFGLHHTWLSCKVSDRWLVRSAADPKV